MADIPSYIFKLGISEEVVSKVMVKILEDFNIYFDEEKAMKLLNSILVYFIHYIDTHPGQYLKLKHIDLTADKDNFLSIKRSSDYTEDMVTPQMLYDKYCGEAMIREELQKSIDMFAESFLNIRAKKQVQVRSLDNIIRRRKKLADEVKKCTEIVRFSDKYKQQVQKQRKADEKKVRSMIRRKEISSFISNAELKLRNKYKQQYELMELELRRQWATDKNKFPFE